MIEKRVPLVRYNPHNLIFKWEYDYEVKYIPEDGDKVPAGLPTMATGYIGGPPARLTKKGAIKAAKRKIEGIERNIARDEAEWEEV